MTEPLSIPALVARLDAALAAHPGTLLATDADGTIWEGDVGVELFETLLAAGAVREAAREALEEEARLDGVAVPAGGDATAVARALYEAHLAGAYPNDRAFAMMAWAFAGHTRGEVRACADRVLE